MPIRAPSTTSKSRSLKTVHEPNDFSTPTRAASVVTAGARRCSSRSDGGGSSASHRLEVRPDRRPLVVEHRVPGRVAVPPLDDHVLAEDALEREPEPFGRRARPGVQRVALPFHAAVAQLVERFLQHQVHGLGVRAGALRTGRVPDVAELQVAHRRVDAHERHDAHGIAGRAVDHREEQRVLRRRQQVQPAAHRRLVGPRPVRHVRPHARRLVAPVVRGREQAVSVHVGVDGDERDVSALERSACRPSRGRRPDGRADGSLVRAHGHVARAASAASASTSSASSSCSSVITSGGMWRRTL